MRRPRSEEHTSELQSPCNLVCRLLLEKNQKQMLFSDQFLAEGQVEIVQTSNTTSKSNADLTGKKVGAQVDTTGAMEIDNIFFNDTETTEIYTLSLHDALPI